MSDEAARARVALGDEIVRIARQVFGPENAEKMERRIAEAEARCRGTAEPGPMCEAGNLVDEYAEHGIDLNRRPWLEGGGLPPGERIHRAALEFEAALIAGNPSSFALGLTIDHVRRMDRMARDFAEGGKHHADTESADEVDAEFEAMMRVGKAMRSAEDRRRAHTREAHELGVTEDQLSEINFAVIKATRVREAELGGGPRLSELHISVSKLLDWRVSDREHNLEVAARVRGLEALEARFVSLEWRVKNPSYVDPLDLFVEESLVRLGGRVSRAEFGAFVAQMESRFGLSPEVAEGREDDTPETLDPELGEEAQQDAREIAVREAIGNAIGVVQGVCSGSDERDSAVHQLRLGIDRAVDAARR